MVLFTGIPGDNVLPILFSGVLIGLVVFAALALARWTQADLESLLPIAPEIEPSIALLRPTRSLVFAGLVGSLISLGAILNVGLAIDFGLSFADMPQVWADRRGRRHGEHLF